MAGPGLYRPDPSEGITRPEDLPPPQILYSCRDAKQHPCPRCGHQAYRNAHIRSPRAHSMRLC